MPDVRGNAYPDKHDGWKTMVVFCMWMDEQEGR